MYYSHLSMIPDETLFSMMSKNRNTFYFKPNWLMKCKYCQGFYYQSWSIKVQYLFGNI